MLEYLILMIFVVAIIIVIIFMLSFYQISQINAEKNRNQQEKALTLLKQFSSSPYMVSENSVFEDGLLTALGMGVPSSCESLQREYGSDWYAEITLMDGEPVRECFQANYPDCNHWKICQKQESLGKIIRVIPVNVKRRIGFVLDTTNSVLPRVYPAKLNMTLYI